MMRNRMLPRFLFVASLVCFILLVSVAAQAAELLLPSGLKRIEEQAFYGDTSLDTVTIQEGTETIASEAFSQSSIKSVTLPVSLHHIADDAFSYCDDLIVDAQEGTYAYAWAVKNGYINISAGSETRVIMPDSLQAGMNLEIQVYGPANTVSHTVFLINNATKKGETRWIREQNGIVFWEGYELENGSYTAKVYTVTDDYSGSTPVSKDLIISGTRPVGPEDIELPEKIGWDGAVISFDPYDKLLGKYSFYDEEGNLLDNYEEYSWDEEKTINIWRGHENAVRLDISFRSYKDGLWSEWSSVKSIDLVNSYNNTNWPGLKNLSIPDSILAGTDFEISFELEDGIYYYYAGLYDENGNSIQTRLERNNSSGALIVPGYKTEPGTYRLNIDAEAEVDGEYINYTLTQQTVTILEERKPAAITLSADKDSAYINQGVELSISSNGTEGAYIKIIGDTTTYKGCNLQEDGSGTCNTTLDVLYSETKSKTVTLSACVFLGDSWSGWSDPITIDVSRPEPLPVPVITVSDSYETGEDIIVGLEGVEDADYYYVDLIEYFSGESVIHKSYYKNNSWSNFGEDVVFSGSQFGSGTYQIRVRAYSSVRQSSSTTKTVRVAGTRASAPSVTFDPDEFRINQTTTFTIDTTDCEQIYLRYNGYGDQNSWSDSYNIVPTGDSTIWTYRFSNDAENADFSFIFTAKKNGKWTAAKEIRRTVLGLPPLDQALIHVDETVEAGTDFRVVVDAVENATSYTYRLYLANGNSYSYSERIGEYGYNGYELDPGQYTIKVWAYSDDYATSISEKTFTITGAKAQAPIASVDKTEVFTNENYTFTIDTANAEALVVKHRNTNGDAISIQGDETQWSHYAYEWSPGIWSYQFAVLKDGKWSAWSNPIEINARNKPNLNQPDVQVAGRIDSGSDFKFSFGAVTNASSYSASFASAYGGNTLYSWESGTVEPDSELTVPGYLINSGSYTLSVTAYADGFTSSTKTVYVTASGQRPTGPAVTVKEPLRIKSTVTFSIDTEGADELRVKYQYTAQYNWWSEQNMSIPVTGNTTVWEHSIGESYEGVNLTVSFSTKKNGAWSYWKTNTYTIAGLPPLEPAVIHVDETIAAGHDVSIIVDSVENASSYQYYLYLPDGSYWRKYDSNYINEHIYSGYNLEPGEYKFKVWAYSDDYATSTSEKVFIISGTKADAPSVEVSKADVKVQEYYIFTIDSENADMLYYRVNNNSPYKINILEAETQWSTYSYYAGAYSYSFAIRRNGIWSSWSDPITINVTNYDPIDTTDISIISPLESGRDLVVSLSAVDGATSYELYLQKSDGTVSFSYTVSPQNIGAYSFPGYRLTPGSYTISAYARNAHVSSEASQKSIVLSVTLKPDAPSVSAPESVSSGNYFNFVIDTTDADLIALRSYAPGNTNDISYNTKSVQEGQEATSWQMYFNGSTRKYAFALRKDGMWSEWSDFITISASQSNN